MLKYCRYEMSFWTIYLQILANKKEYSEEKREIIWVYIKKQGDNCCFLKFFLKN